MARIFVVSKKESGNREIYERLLAVGGHEVRMDSTDKDLITSLFECKPDIIIVDVIESDLKAFSLIRELRTLPQFSPTPVLMVLNESSEEIEMAVSVGANEYIIKPIREMELASRIELLLNKSNLFSNDFTPGTVFAKRYRIMSLLGKGGDSTVYRALDTSQSPQKDVALKIIKVKEDIQTASMQFDREVDGLSRLEHPNIVKLIDHGEFEGVLYLATEFIQGRSLREIIKETPLAEETAVDLGLEVAEALNYMNQFGILHRDIKPDNILISDIGEVILVDFGLSREEDQQTVSIKGEMSGTPQYLAPEYIDGKKLNVKTDIYSLGITLFYMVSGELPFQAGTPMALLSKQLNEKPPVLNEITHGISPEFAALVDRMLLKDPQERISLDDMVVELKNLKKHRDEE